MKTNGMMTTRKRLLIGLVSIIFLFTALCGRLFYLQILAGGELKERAAEQWYRDLPLRAKRGTIFDRNGEVLVENKDVFTVYARPRAVADKAGAARALAARLKLNEQALFEKLNKSAVSEITVKKGVDFETGASLRDMGLAGVYFSVDSARSYPNSTYLPQVLGYTNVDNRGQTGLEVYYDKYLKGVDGVSLTATDNQGVELKNNVTTYVPAIPGADMTLSVDLHIQAFVEAAIDAAKEEWKAKSASMIVMDVKTGGITALGITPSYDLADIPRNDIDLLNAYSKNTMIVDVYEPGSTFKIFTTAAAVEAGVVGDKDTFHCGGYHIVDGQRIKCWRTVGHGTQTLAGGVKNSCNVVFMTLAQRLGTKRFYEYLRAFGFGAKTGVDFFAESGGLLMKEEQVKTVDLARIGFGQAVAVTPLQLIAGVSAVINGGYAVTPHFATGAADPYGTVLFERVPETKRVLSEATSQKMATLLEAVVAEGSGKKASVPGYRIGGKTGTAQKYENGAIAQGKYISSFVGYAPAEDPRYAVLMIIDEPGTYAYYGSVVAAPYVGQVFKKIFDYQNIPPSTAVKPAEYVEMPQLYGCTPTEAARALKNLGLQYEIAGDGKTVTDSLPIAGTQVERGDVVIIRVS